MKTKIGRKKEQGFTLIEIISVLVILGILAAVAVPKFVDLQNEAKKKSADGLVAAGLSQLNMAYAQNLLSGDGDTAAAWTAVSGTNAQGICNEVQLTGYTSASLTCTGSPVSITATVDGQTSAAVIYSDPSAE